MCYAIQYTYNTRMICCLDDVFDEGDVSSDTDVVETQRLHGTLHLAYKNKTPTSLGTTTHSACWAPKKRRAESVPLTQASPRRRSRYGPAPAYEQTSPVTPALPAPARLPRDFLRNGSPLHPVLDDDEVVI